LFAPSIPLKCRVEEITQYRPAENDIFLSRDVLDKQIIDTDGARVVRVNDLELVRVNGTLYVGNVDIGMLGVLRRLGVAGVTQRVTSLLGLPESKTFSSCGTILSCACAYRWTRSLSFIRRMSRRSSAI
jgi:hypothetical protein